MAFDRVSDPSTWTRFDTSWPSSQSKTLVCDSIRNETHDVKTFCFAADDHSIFSFEPGQFVTVNIDTGLRKETRCYTVSSSPTRPFTLSITVKRVPGGIVSNWLHDTLRVGQQLQVYGPSGGFTTTGNPARKFMFLSAGSGITPLMSIARACADLASERDIMFVHSARTPGDIIFRDELGQLGTRLRNFRVLHVVEDVGVECDWTGPVGRLNAALLHSHVPDFLEREAFVCGPTGYMDTVRSMLNAQGHDAAKYHSESFDFSANALAGAVISSASVLEDDVLSTECAVRLSKSGRIFTVRSRETVLAAAKRAGVAIASSCSQGVCGTCKAMVLEGEVEMSHGGGIRQREIDKGLRLLCCSRPMTNLVIDL